MSMFCLFGTKFIKLFSGPMWAVATTAQSAEDSKENMGHLHPIEVCTVYMHTAHVTSLALYCLIIFTGQS